MDEREAIARLLKRAQARRAERRQRNESDEAPPVCLHCGAEACRFETLEPAQVFCAQRDCQLGFHALLRLGVDPPVGGKRALPVDDERVADWDALPDDVLCLLLLQAFDWRLETEAQYDELMIELVSVSQRFARVIRDCVVPQIHTLDPSVVRHRIRDNDALARFRALRKLDLKPGWTEQLTPDVLAALPRLEWLAVRRTPISAAQLARLPATLGELYLLDVPDPGADPLRGLTHLHALTVTGAWVTDAVLLPLADSLKQLQFSRETQLTDLSRMSALAAVIALQSDQPYRGAGELAHSLVRLPNLISLRCAGTRNFLSSEALSLLSRLRYLAISECRGTNNEAWLDTAALLSLTKLETLRVNNMPELRAEHLANLRVLWKLEAHHSGVAFPANVRQADWARRLGALRWLNMEASYLAGEGLLDLPHLLRLDASDSFVADLHLRNLTALTHLDLRGHSLVTVAGLRPLVALAELDLRGNAGIDDPAMLNKPALRLLRVNRFHGTSDAMRTELRALGVTVIDDDARQ